jgi:sugar phosphate isomerase/epimerase
MRQHPGPEPMHERLVVNQVSMPPGAPLEADVRLLRDAGVTRMGVVGDKLAAAGWDEGIAALERAGMAVPYLILRAPFRLAEPAGRRDEVARAQRTIDTAAALGAPLVYLTTGPGGSLTWEEAADRFVDAFGPVAEHAAAAGVRLALETTNPQFADVDILHTLAATVELAERAGAAVCLDVHATWTEPGLAANIARAAGRLALVQVSDYVPGSRTLARAVPGDGVIPLERILGDVLDGGYGGPIDLELFGARDEDPVAAVLRGIAYLETMLERLEVVA